MIILFQNILFLKQFLACNGCFGLFTKIKKGSWTGFWCIISAWFFHKNVPYLILYQLTKFQCQIFFLSSNIKQNELLSSYLDNCWRHKLEDLSWIIVQTVIWWKNEKEPTQALSSFSIKILCNRMICNATMPSYFEYFCGVGLHLEVLYMRKIELFPFI